MAKTLRFLILLGLPALCQAAPGVGTAWSASCPEVVEPAQLASTATLRALDAQMRRFGVRATGTANHRRFVAWLERELHHVPGMQVESLETDIERWDVRSVGLHVAGARIPLAAVMPYGKPTGRDGITAPLSFVAAGEEITAANAAGRIVALEQPPGKERDFIAQASAAGALGLVIVKQLPRAQIAGFYRPYDGIVWPVPGVYVGADEGRRLAAAGARGGATATLIVDATLSPATTRSLLATLPGNGGDPARLVVASHTDGVNALWDNGPIAMIAIARYLAALPASCRKRTVEFAFTTAHLYQRLSGARQAALQLDAAYDRGEAAGVVVLEHLGARAYATVPRPDGVGNRLVRTDAHEPLAVFTSESDALRAAVSRQIQRHGLDATPLLHGLDAYDAGRVPHRCDMGGEGGPYNRRLLPVVAAIATSPTLFTPAFGLEAIDFDHMRNQTIAFTDLLLDMSAMPRAAIAGDVLAMREQRAAGVPGCPPEHAQTAADDR